MREIKFRQFTDGRWWYWGFGLPENGRGFTSPVSLALNSYQYTGLKDKNGDKEVYEGDIVDTEGNIIGNQYETPALLKRKSNLLVQGFGTKAWLTTYQEAVDRGCHDS